MFIWVRHKGFMSRDLRFPTTCADPGVFVRGGSRSVWQKSSDVFFFVFFQSSAFFTEVKWSISKKSIIFQGSRRGLTFSRGGGGGSNCLFPIETHKTCDFPAGGGSGPPAPPPPLDPHLNNVVCATSKGSDQPDYTRRLIRAFACRLNSIWVFSYRQNIIWSFWA